MVALNTWVSRSLRLLVLLHAALLVEMAAFQRTTLTGKDGLKAQVWIMCLLGVFLFADLVTPQAPNRKNGKVLDTILVFLWLILLVAGITIGVGTGLV
jgi:hypothetical protein